MAVELSNAALQTVAAGGNVQFADNPLKCNKGYVIHRDGAGVVTLKGITQGQCRALYRVIFGANITVPTGGTLGPVSIALAIDGEPLNDTVMTVTPAAIGDLFSVSRTTFISVPRGCCMSFAVENTTVTAAGVPAPVDVQNANLVIERVA